MTDSCSNKFRLPPPLAVLSKGMFPNITKSGNDKLKCISRQSVLQRKTKKFKLFSTVQVPRPLTFTTNFYGMKTGWKETWETVWKTWMQDYCSPRKNEVLESHIFWNVQYREPFDNFLTEDRMIINKIVVVLQVDNSEIGACVVLLIGVLVFNANLTIFQLYRGINTFC